MTDLKVFNFEENNVRTLVIEDEPYFVGNDVAKVLGYSNYRNAVSNKVDKDDKLRTRIEYAGQYREMTLVNESGLYSLIFSSELDSAKKFKRWVTSEVLPQIRKQGLYMTNTLAEEIQNNPEIIHFLAEQVAKINTANNQYHVQTAEKLNSIDKKIEGEYVTPQDIYAINYAIKVKSEKFVDDAGVQMTIDTVLSGDVYEQAKASKKAKEQRTYDIGKMKRKILVAVKKYLGMKGNAPNNHIKRKDVDTSIQFIKNLQAYEVR
ncbi:BRO-N domain-containing protein [Oceanobacillus oncorhynchi]|uniref:BRO-N domain-containing protein n=1 Tax=Oceanobacillus oncorhynchi TaxID=545501 RepID=UPI0025A4BF5B|nr:BRO family protein [Oceanobacillus oncorhynchi]MDM8098703.1 BRO family protein [Oceanobacillus oncorhynchi]